MEQNIVSFLNLAKRTIITCQFRDHYSKPLLKLVCVKFCGINFMDLFKKTSLWGHNFADFVFHGFVHEH